MQATRQVRQLLSGMKAVWEHQNDTSSAISTALKTLRGVNPKPAALAAR